MIMERLLIKSRINYHKILIIGIIFLLVVKTFLEVKESNYVFSYISELERKSKAKNSDIRNNTILVKKDDKYFVLDSTNFKKLDSAFKEVPSIKNNLLKLE